MIQNKKLFRRILLMGILAFLFCIKSDAQSLSNKGSWKKLNEDAASYGKPAWRDMLVYTAKLHQKSTHPARWPFQYEWEEIGPGYHMSPAFGHWDIIHQALDEMRSYPEHALHQLLNNIENQEPSGMIPGSIWMSGGNAQRDTTEWNKSTEGHPPVWVFAVQDYIEFTDDNSILKHFFSPLVRQITWFENNRKAEGEGFYYNDILLKKWESGVDEGVRFDQSGMGPWACVDATSHIYALYNHAVKWGKIMGMDTQNFEKRRDGLRAFIMKDLYVEKEEMFYDIWAVKNPAQRHLVFESMWPIVVGAASKEQADQYIDRYLMNENIFLTKHPIATVGKTDPKFEARMWRGPAWNSMTYWAAIGCLRYNRPLAAKKLLEMALDDTAKQFDRTGTIWEFYDSLGGKPENLERKPDTDQNSPCKDYLGHNPVIEMARMYDGLNHN